MNSSRDVGAADVWRRYWPLHALAVIFFIVVVIFGVYLVHRAAVLDERNERIRAGMCALLANIPGDVPSYIATARKQFARPDYPHDCQPLAKAKTRAAATARRPSVTPQPRQTVVIVLTPGQAASPAASRTATPRPSPSHSPSHSPSPRPSPSPSRTPCLIPGVPPGCG